MYSFKKNYIVLFIITILSIFQIKSQNDLCPDTTDMCLTEDKMVCSSQLTEFNSFVTNYNNALQYMNQYLTANTLYQNTLKNFNNNVYNIDIPTNSAFNLGPISATCVDCILPTGKCAQDISVSNSLQSPVSLPTDCQTFISNIIQSYAPALSNAQIQLVNFLSTNSSCTQLKIDKIPQKQIAIGTSNVNLYDFDAVDSATGKSYICEINQIITKMKNTMDKWSEKCSIKAKSDLDAQYAQQSEAQSCDTSMVRESELNQITSISDFLRAHSDCAKKWDAESAKTNNVTQISWKLNDYNNYTSDDDKLCARIRYAYDHPSCIAQVRAQEQYEEQVRTGKEQAAQAATQGWIGMGVGLAGQIPMLALMYYQHKQQMAGQEAGKLPAKKLSGDYLKDTEANLKSANADTAQAFNLKSDDVMIKNLKTSQQSIKDAEAALDNAKKSGAFPDQIKEMQAAIDDAKFNVSRLETKVNAKQWAEKAAADPSKANIENALKYAKEDVDLTQKAMSKTKNPLTAHQLGSDLSDLNAQASKLEMQLNVKEKNLSRLSAEEKLSKLQIEAPKNIQATIKDLNLQTSKEAVGKFSSASSNAQTLANDARSKLDQWESGKLEFADAQKALADARKAVDEARSEAANLEDLAKQAKTAGEADDATKLSEQSASALKDVNALDKDLGELERIHGV